jgi:hypothetical protein
VRAAGASCGTFNRTFLARFTSVHRDETRQEGIPPPLRFYALPIQPGSYAARTYGRGGEDGREGAGAQVPGTGCIVWLEEPQSPGSGDLVLRRKLLPPAEKVLEFLQGTHCLERKRLGSFFG